MANQRAAGCRLVKTATVKIKCINIVHITGAHWAYLWNTGWNPSRLTACLNFAQSIGANAVKITGNGIGPDVASNSAYTDNYPDDVTFRSRIQWFFAQCRAMGLKVYWNLNSEPARWLGADGSQGAVNLPIIAKLVGWLHYDGADLLVAIDIQNELNGASNRPTTWGGNTNPPTQVTTDLRSLMNACRQATDIPLTASVIMHSPSEITTSSNIAIQTAIGCDFHDFHPYYQVGSYTAGGLVPAGTDVANLEGRSDYLGRHFMGENGCALAAGAAYQASWMQGLGQQVSRGQSHGGNAFCITDFDTVGSDQWGFCDSNVANPRPQLVMPFQAWPAWL